MFALRPTRREMLAQSALGFGSLALASLLSDDGLLATEPAAPPLRSSLRSIVFIFLGGGPAQTDTFDPKPMLTRLDGRPMPGSLGESPRTTQQPLMMSPWRFRRYGQSGLEISDLFPHLGRCADDLCILRSCAHDSPIHAPAEFLTTTGSLLGERPSLGAWVTYGLGSENRDLPGFIVFRTGETIRPPSVASGFLPASFQGVAVASDGRVAHLDMPAGVTLGERSAQLEFLRALNERHAQSSHQSELEARIASYELGFRMQTAAPQAFDLAQETAETKRLYGLGESPAPGVDQKDNDEYARIFLLTRRLVERGVRFIQIRSGGWDSHADILNNHGKKCGATDRPIAAFLTDLKRRGLLQQTLVIWGGEFGRTPTSQRGAVKPGRDHSPTGYSMWLAGGGVQGGQAIGATDEVGYAAVDHPIHPRDLHATMLHAMGIEQRALYYERHARREIVTVNGGSVVREVFR